MTSLHPHRVLPLIVALAVLVAGCGGDDAEPPPEPEEVEVAVDPTADMPAQKQDTILVEGMPEPVTLGLFYDEALPVAMYYPQDDFEPEVVTSSQATAVHFVVTFGGVRNEDASIRLFFPHEFAPLNDPAQLETLVLEPDGLADVEGFTLEETDARLTCPQASQTWSVVADDGRLGYMCISNRSNRWFLVIATYPAEYGDGFEPRAAVILQEMTWVDTASN